MKRILALILVCLLIVPFASCGKKVNKMSLRELYENAYEKINSMTSYELVITTKKITYYEDFSWDTTTVSEYKTDGASKIYSSEEKSAHYFDGMSYIKVEDNKEKVEMTAEDFQSSYWIDIHSFLPTADESFFEGKALLQNREEYRLSFSVTPENYIWGHIDDNAEYRIAFDEDGEPLYVFCDTYYESESEMSIEVMQTVEFKRIGDAEKISAPEDALTYRDVPKAEEIDKTPIADFGSLQLSGNEGRDKTEHVMLDVAGYGKMVIRLYADVAPKTVENFSNLVASGFYDQKSFYNVSNGALVQCGDKSNGKIVGEFKDADFTNNLSHVKGVVSMDHEDLTHSNSTDFCIIHSEKMSGRDSDYAAFGYVVYGMEVLDAIANAQVDEEGQPMQSIVVTSARFVTIG